MLYVLKMARSAVLRVVSVPVTPITCIYSLGISANEKLPQRSVILMACHSHSATTNKSKPTAAAASNSGRGSNNKYTPTDERRQQRPRQQQQQTSSRKADKMMSADS
jgi:hypothetical protein